VSRTLRQAIAVLSILVLAATACSNSSDDDASPDTESDGSDAAASGEEDRDTFVEIAGVPGVTDDAINFAAIGTRSNNILGTCILDCYMEGINAYFAFRNSEGGIFGRDLVLSQDLDDALGNNQAVSLEVVSDDEVFGAFQATLLPTGWGDLHDAGIPTYAWGIHADEAANRDHIFPSTTIQCADCTGRALPWLAKEAGATKIASIGYGDTENSKVCTQNNAKSVELYAEDTGQEVVYVNDELSYGLSGGVGAEVTTMKDAGVDFILSCLDLNAMKTFAQELSRQGMDDVQMVHPNTYNQAFVTEAGDLFEGDYVSVQFLPFEADAEGTALEDYFTWIEETGAEPSELAMAGWINATLVFDGLLAAGPEFDRDKVVAATNHLAEWSAGGLTEPVDWATAHTPFTNDSRPDDAGDECSAVVQIVDGTFETVMPPATPWLCFPPGTDWTEPEPVSFG
jgi:Periplasmic binding protein